PARAPGEEGDCARGGNCGHGRVPDREFLPDASLPCRERAHLFGTPARFVDSSLGYDLHDPLAPGPAYGRVIGKASHQEGIVDAHEPKTDLPGPPCCIADLRDGENIPLDDEIEEPGGHAGSLPEFVLVKNTIVHAGCEVNAAEHAALVREKRLFAAGIGSVDLTELRRRVPSVDLIKEQDARLAVLPDPINHPGPDMANRDRFPGVRMGDPDGLKLLAGDEVHELVIDHNGNVEVGELAFLGLCIDEGEDVRVPDIEDPHVRPATAASLLDHLGCGVEDPHE